ncbi:MAG TPA: apolipoprotein N-acyltransferase, partial [Bacteroidales bacterium]|nr:apolipoprotein N-acyltransferase [Bacteroidales bacterium]
LLSIGLFSFSLLKAEPKTDENSLEFAVIQPNIDPFAEKFSGLSPADQLDLILRLADSVATPATKYFIAPETSIIYPIWVHEPEKHPAYEPIRQFLAKHPGASLLIGAYTYSKVAEPTGISLQDTDGSWYNIHNSALIYLPNGKVEIYHKSKLLIGPETIPWAGLLKYLQVFSINLGGIVGSYTTQPEAEVFACPENDARLAPIICYESVFGEYTGEFVRKNANLLAIITNDGWWGTSEGYLQHLRFSQLRAIETGKWVVRSANTGVSCIISPSGKIIKQTQYGVRTAFTYQVPLSETKTYYSQTGDYIGRLAALLTFLIGFYVLVQQVIANKKV